MTDLQKQALKQVSEILEAGQKEIFMLSYEEDDTKLATDFRQVSRDGTAGNKILSSLNRSLSWIESILSDEKRNH